MSETYPVFPSRDVEGIKSELNTCQNLTLEAKLALQRIIKSECAEAKLDNNKLDALDGTTDRELNRIHEMALLNRFGLDLTYSENERIIYTHRSSTVRDVFGLIVGGAMFLMIIPAVLLWKTLLAGGAGFGPLMGVFLTTFIFLTGLVVLRRVIDRMLFYKDFKIVKDSKGISVFHRPNLALERHDFSPEAKLITRMEEDILLLMVSEQDTETTILQWKKVGMVNRESIKALCTKFNQ